MRLLAVFLAVLVALTGFAPAQAMDNPALYRVTGVAEDITADNATAARDQAILKALRDGFARLLDQMGADPAVMNGMNDQAVAALAQAFEVEQEKTSSVRYIGTFTIQFKPEAVRALLNSKGVSYSEGARHPVVVLPIMRDGDHAVLWQDTTAWRAAWDAAAVTPGTPPVVVPPGDLDDVAAIDAKDALAGKPEALQAIMNRYKADAVLVATLNAPLDSSFPRPASTIDVTTWRAGGSLATPDSMPFDAVADDAAFQAAMTASIGHIRHDLETNWQAANRVPTGPIQHMVMSVPLPSLAVWNTIRDTLSAVPNIANVHVLSLSRGDAQIDVAFRGEVPQLQEALLQHQLDLQQAGADNGWQLLARSDAAPNTPF